MDIAQAPGGVSKRATAAGEVVAAARGQPVCFGSSRKLSISLPISSVPWHTMLAWLSETPAMSISSPQGEERSPDTPIKPEAASRWWGRWWPPCWT